MLRILPLLLLLVVVELAVDIVRYVAGPDVGVDHRGDMTGAGAGGTGCLVVSDLHVVETGGEVLGGAGTRGVARVLGVRHGSPVPLVPRPRRRKGVEGVVRFIEGGGGCPVLRFGWYSRSMTSEGVVRLLHDGQAVKAVDVVRAVGVVLF